MRANRNAPAAGGPHGAKNVNVHSLKRAHSLAGAGSKAVDFDRINAAALAALPAICARLFPGGKVIAGEYVALNPRRADRRPGSFKINLTSGAWADFATDDRGGDPVSLVAFREGVDQPTAARKLAAMLGVEER